MDSGMGRPIDRGNKGDDSEQSPELFDCKSNLSDDGPKGPAGNFLMVRNRYTSVRGNPLS